jgi:hypothetical protein
MSAAVETVGRRKSKSTKRRQTRTVEQSDDVLVALAVRGGTRSPVERGIDDVWEPIPVLGLVADQGRSVAQTDAYSGCHGLVLPSLNRYLALEDQSCG